MKKQRLFKETNSKLYLCDYIFSTNCKFIVKIIQKKRKICDFICKNGKIQLYFKGKIHGGILMAEVKITQENKKTITKKRHVRYG